MDLEFSLDLISHALWKVEEDKIWQMWLVQFGNMDKEHFVDFEEYKSRFMPKKVSDKTYEEIESEFEKVIKAYERR